LIDVSSLQEVDAISVSTTPYTLTIYGTYASDFNAIEYAQRVRYYLPLLREKNVESVNFIVNGSPDAARKLASLTDLPSSIRLLSDVTGAAGRAFGVRRGWRPDDEQLSPYFKLYMMLFGVGAWATLPAVIGGYIGNPFTAQPWIEDAMRTNILKQRFPTSGLKLSDDNEKKIISNNFANLPVVGSWKRRPLELATLRLQNMIGISFQNWDALKPDDDNLNLLTQLGGCLVTDSVGKERYKFIDNGICNVCNFETMLENI